MFRQAPSLGWGTHTFGALYQVTLSHVALPAWAPLEGRFVPWPHDLYLEVAAEQGLLGLGALVAVLALGIRTAWRGRRSAAPHARGLTASPLAALLGVAAAGVVELTLLRQWVVMLLFVLLGTATHLERCPMHPEGG